MSSLSRIAVDNHRFVSIEENDTVVLSARIIPGNEKAIFRMIDHFFRRQVLVYYEGGRSAPIHVSGHASQEEMKLVLNLVRPKYFVPLHGEYRHLFRHAALAEQVGAVSGEIFLLESGQPIEFTSDGAHRREPVTAGRVLVDSGSLEEIEEVVIRERRHLAEDGVVVPILAIDKHTGRLEGQPEIVSRGFVPSDDGQELMAKAREVILKTIEQSTAEEKTDWGVIKEKIRVDLKRFLNKQTAKRPLILPVICADRIPGRIDAGCETAIGGEGIAAADISTGRFRHALRDRSGLLSAGDCVLAARIALVSAFAGGRRNCR
jgi:ribonuclease J